MSGFNRVVLLGNVTRDPTLRQTPGGTAVLDLGLAVNEAYRNAAGETVERACFVDVVTWGKQAENCERYLRKGRPVLVEGRLQLDQWTTEGGEKRSRIRVKADRVQFLGGGKPAAASADRDTAGVEETTPKEGGEGVVGTDGDVMPF